MTSLLPIPGAFPITYGVDNWHLVQISTEDGDILFDRSPIGSGIKAINIDDTIKAEKYYTLNGVEISKPQAQGVYVKVMELNYGKKITEKFIEKYDANFLFKIVFKTTLRFHLNY